MKEKISISFDKDLLKEIDKYINNHQIRNRSQAMEYIIRKGLTQKKVSKALILAGGKNLKHKGIYKPLTKVNGEEVIKQTVRKLSNAGIKEITIATFLTKEIQEIIGNGSNLGVNINYIEDSNLGTAGAIKLASSTFSSDFFVTFGDIVFDFDLTKMIEFHNSHKELVTLAVSTTTLEESMDNLVIEGEKVIKFNYAPKARSFTVNAGIYILKPEILKMLPNRGSLEKDVLPKLAQTNQITAYNFSGKWEHLN